MSRSSGSNAISQFASTGYSARVSIELLVDGKCIPVAQSGGGRLIFDQPVKLPESEGEVVMRIDGHERRWRVALRPGPEPSCIVAVVFDPN